MIQERKKQRITGKCKAMNSKAERKWEVWRGKVKLRGVFDESLVGQDCGELNE